MNNSGKYLTWAGLSVVGAFALGYIALNRGEQINALWREITRTARPGARVIFRTAAEPSLLPGRLKPSLLGQWRYDEDESLRQAARDRSAIYGGFHLYVLRD